MKKQCIFVLALSTLILLACEEEHLVNPQSYTTTAPAINSFYPESAVCGVEVILSGENFGVSIADNYVTFDGAYAEVTGVGTGMVKVKVPMNLLPGDYTINLSANGLTSTSAKVFKVTRF